MGLPVEYFAEAELVWQPVILTAQRLALLYAIPSELLRGDPEPDPEPDVIVQNKEEPC